MQRFLLGLILLVSMVVAAAMALGLGQPSHAAMGGIMPPVELPIIS